MKFSIGMSLGSDNCEICWFENSLERPQFSKAESKLAQELKVDLLTDIGSDLAYGSNEKTVSLSEIFDDLILTAIQPVSTEIEDAKVIVSYPSHFDSVAIDAIRTSNSHVAISSARFVRSDTAIVQGLDQAVANSSKLALVVDIYGTFAVLSALSRASSTDWNPVSIPVFVSLDEANLAERIENRYREASNNAMPFDLVVICGAAKVSDSLKTNLAKYKLNAKIVGHTPSIRAKGASFLITPKSKGESVSDNENGRTGLSQMLGKKEYEQVFEEARKKPLVFLIVGRTGVGKSSIVNSLLGRSVAEVGAYEPTTFEVKEYDYEEGGIKFKFVDTPGLCDDLKEKGNDIRYINKMKTKVKEIHSIWFVSRLSDTRISSDEIRAIKVISEAFEDKEKVWERALIVFTFANSPPNEEEDVFPLNFEISSRLLRKKIGQEIGNEQLAEQIPTVAIDNKSEKTLDGKFWIGSLYTKIMDTLKGDELITFFLGTVRRVPKESSRPSKYEDDFNREPYSEWEPEHRTKVKKDVCEQVHRSYEEKFRSGGEKIDRALGTSFVSSTLGAVGRGLDWFFGK